MKCTLFLLKRKPLPPLTSYFFAPFCVVIISLLVSSTSRNTIEPKINLIHRVIGALLIIFCKSMSQKLIIAKPPPPGSAARSGPQQPGSLMATPSARQLAPRPPERGVFPLDHFGECKEAPSPSSPALRRPLPTDCRRAANRLPAPSRVGSAASTLPPAPQLRLPCLSRMNTSPLAGHACLHGMSS